MVHNATVDESVEKREALFREAMGYVDSNVGGKASHVLDELRKTYSKTELPDNVEQLWKTAHINGMNLLLLDAKRSLTETERVLSAMEKSDLTVWYYNKYADLVSIESSLNMAKTHANSIGIELPEEYQLLLSRRKYLLDMQHNLEERVKIGYIPFLLSRARDDLYGQGPLKEYTGPIKNDQDFFGNLKLAEVEIRTAERAAEDYKSSLDINEESESVRDEILEVLRDKSINGRLNEDLYKQSV